MPFYLQSLFTVSLPMDDILTILLSLYEAEIIYVVTKNRDWLIRIHYKRIKVCKMDCPRDIITNM